MTHTNTNPLGHAPIRPLFFKLAIPAVVAQLVNMLYNMVDRAYIGHMADTGPIALVGIGVSNPVIMLIAAFAMLIGTGAAPRAAIALGAKKDASAQKILNTALTASILTGVLLTIIFLIFLEPILRLVGASDASLPYAKSYLGIYLIGTVPVMISLGMNQLISVQGFAKASMLTVLIGAVLNIILDPIFIFTFDMGIKGAALATIFSQSVSALWVLKFLRGDKTQLKINPALFSLKPAILLPILALGLSPFIMNATESLLQIAFNRSLYTYGGDLYVATLSINAILMQFLFLPASGFTQGGMSLISYNYGAKNKARVMAAIKILALVCFSYAAVFTGLVQLFPRLFIRLFTNNPELINATIPCLRIYMAGAFMLGLQIACQQSFIAFGRAKASTFLAILRKIILLIPLIHLLPHLIKPQVYAVYWAEPISDIIASVVTTLSFVYFLKHEIKRELGA